MRMINQQYVIEVPAGNGTENITLQGLQEYSPGQTRRVDIWLFATPPSLNDRLPDGWECRTFADAMRTVARAFFDGDEQAAQAAIRSA